METMRVYLRIYGTCLRDAATAIARSAWTLLLPAVILLARDWAGRLAAPLGVVGGILVTLVTAALFSSYLYFLGELARGGRVSVREVGGSLGAYLWSIVNVYFVVWIASLLLQLLLGGGGSAAVLYALWLVAVVAFNAVPEVIYLRGTYGGVQTIAASWEFLKAQWIPWFVANVPLLAALALLAGTIQGGVVGDLVLGAALHVVMVFRGRLFRALDGSSHRRRMFEQRVA